MEAYSHDLEERRNYLQGKIAQQRVHIHDYQGELDELEIQAS